MASKNGVTNGIAAEEDSSGMFPGFGPRPVDESDFKNYRVRYAQIDIMDVGSRAELEIIETRAVKGQGVIILTKDKFTFMDKYYMVVSYLELERQDADTNR